MKPKKTILIVEDEPDIIKYIKEILTGKFDVETATTGSQALDKAKEFLPDIILLDIMLRKIDGFEVCRQIKNDPDLENTKIIIQSAKAMKQDKEDGLKAGADAYITKPFDHNTLLETIEDLLGSKN